MEEAIRFFRTFEIWVYILLGLVGLFYIRKFVLAWDDLRNAGFGLERDHAQSRLNSSATILVMLIFLAVAEFVLVTFVAPTMPGATPLSTPTLGLLSTATSTISPAGTQAPSDLTNAVPGVVPTVVFAATPGGGCLSGQIELTSPQNDQEVSGVVEVMGNADIPNFGFYKIEMKLPDAPNWLTIQAGNIPVAQGKLGDWDTRSLNPGEYQLGLVAVDNQARISPPCVVQVRVVRAPDTTPAP